MLDNGGLREQDVVYLGSGFLYGDGRYVCTCAHLFDNRSPGSPLMVRFGDGRWCSAELWDACAAADIALVSIPATFVSSAPAPMRTPKLVQASKTPRQGDWVITCGATQHAVELVAMMGMVSQPKQVLRGGLGGDVGVRYLQLAVTTLPGMSGSPVIDMQGNVVGMMVKKFEEYGLAVPADHIAGVTKSLEQREPWGLPILGMTLENRHGLLVNPRLTVQSVQRRSPASIAGVQDGDELIQVGGRPTSSLLEVREALTLLAHMKPHSDGNMHVELRLRRTVGNSEPFELTLTCDCRMPA